jgi:hypothetical protein
MLLNGLLHLWKRTASSHAAAVEEAFDDDPIEPAAKRPAVAGAAAAVERPVAFQCTMSSQRTGSCLLLVFMLYRVRQQHSSVHCDSFLLGPSDEGFISPSQRQEIT